MGYIDKCTRCYGRGTTLKYDHGTKTYSDEQCPKCAGAGTIKAYRKALSIQESMAQGWDGVIVNSWPEYGVKGFCQCCNEKLTGRKTRWCGSNDCARRVWGRLYAGLHWQKRHVCVRDGCACRECGEKFESPLIEGGPMYPQPRMLELDHIVPLHAGGTEHPDNLQLLCSRCHQEKSTRDRSHYRLKPELQQPLIGGSPQ